MTIEEELVYLREEKRMLREHLAQRDERIQQQQELLAEQNTLLQQHGKQMSRLSEQLKAVQDRLVKDSHNNHLPPSSDRFVRPMGSPSMTAGGRISGMSANMPSASCICYAS